MQAQVTTFEIGDSIIVTGTPYDGELGTVIGVASRENTRRYVIALETGAEIELSEENLSHRR